MTESELAAIEGRERAARALRDLRALYEGELEK